VYIRDVFINSLGFVANSTYVRTLQIMIYTVVFI